VFVENTGFFFGAAAQIRTADLILTKDVLCLLSYSSKLAPFERGKVATQNGLEPSTSSVTGWRSNQLNYWATKCFVIIQNLFRSVKQFFDVPQSFRK